MIISVVTSVYNCQDYVSEMLDSILSQTFQEWECIIIDDASTDDTWNIINKYTDRRIIKIHNNKNVGLTVNLNTGIDLAKGKYILRIDGDDVAYPTRFEKQIAYMENHPDVVLAGCWVKVFGNKVDIWQSTVDSQRLQIGLLFNAVMFHPTFIIRRETLQKYHIRYNQNLKYAQDYNFEYILSKYGKLGNIPEILVRYRTHDRQISVEKSVQQIEYANYTRRMILNDFNIETNEKTFQYWVDFCLLNFHSLQKNEEEILLSFLEKIVLANQSNAFLENKILKDILNSRFKTYLKNCTVQKKTGCEASAEINKYYSLYQMMVYWTKIRQKNKSLVSYFEKRKINDVGIYGMGAAAIRLYEELKNSEICIRYGIDQNIEHNYIDEDLPIYLPDMKLPKVQLLIVTVLSDYEQIVCYMRNRITCEIVSLEEIVFDVLGME